MRAGDEDADSWAVETRQRHCARAAMEACSQAARGAEVKVLTDPGDGWVRLKTQDTNRIGWMSDDFLKTAAN